MKKVALILFALVATATTVQAQEFIYDNLPAGQSSSEISFIGKWCAANLTPYFGTKSLQNCGKPAPSEYIYSPLLTHGVYNIYVRWVSHKKNSTTAHVSVTSTDYFIDIISGVVSSLPSTSDYSVNQTVSSNGWYYIGQFTSVGGAGALSVRLTNEFGDVNTDGIRLVKVADYPVPCNPATGVGCR